VSLGFWDMGYFSLFLLLFLSVTVLSLFLK